MPRKSTPPDLSRLEEQIIERKRRLRERLSLSGELTSPGGSARRLHQVFIAAFGEDLPEGGSRP